MFCLHPRYRADSDKTSGPPATRGSSYIALCASRRIASCTPSKHGVDFAAVMWFNWESAILSEDRRLNYGEQRRVAIGFIGVRLHVMIFTSRGEVIRVIGLRKANLREVKRYEKAQEA